MIKLKIGKMERIIIGSSNVYRFYKPESFASYKKHKMFACTNVETFKVALEDLENTGGGVVISVIENFLCKAARGITDKDTKSNKAKEVVGEFLKALQECATKRPALKFAVVCPIKRPFEPWYTELHGSITKWVVDGIKDMDLGNVAKIGSSAETRWNPSY